MKISMALEIKVGVMGRFAKSKYLNGMKEGYFNCQGKDELNQSRFLEA